MGLLLILAVGLGVFVASQAKAKTSTPGTGTGTTPGGAGGAGGAVPGAGAGAGTGSAPAVDPATENPALGGPRTETVPGLPGVSAPIVGITPNWFAIAAIRLARYAMGPVTPLFVPSSPLPVGDSMAAPFTFKDDLATVPGGPPVLLSRSVAQWIGEQNKAGFAIVVSDALITGKFTETSANASKNNPFLPATITILATTLAALPSVAAPGQGMAVFALPNTLESTTI